MKSATHFDLENFYSLKTSPGKEMNEETLDKYWKEISRRDFFTLEELHVVT